jgi:hypothetical protein
MCPGNHESGGKRRSDWTHSRSKRLAAKPAQAADSAGRSKDTYLGPEFTRLGRRIGHPKARKAVEHSVLVAIFQVMAVGVLYANLSPDWFPRRRSEAHARRLTHQIDALGYHVMVEPGDAA